MRVHFAKKSLTTRKHHQEEQTEDDSGSLSIDGQEYMSNMQQKTFDIDRGYIGLIIQHQRNVSPQSFSQIGISKLLSNKTTPMVMGNSTFKETMSAEPQQ